MNKLAGTRLNLHAISEKRDDKTIENAVGHIKNVKDIEDEIRAIAHNLQKDVFSETSGFISLVEKLIENQNKTQSQQYELEVEANINWETIVTDIKMNLYRIIQEAIHNSNKYAKAGKGSVSIIQDEQSICMTIQDNGIGFETSKTQEGIGLKNMERRVKVLKGEYTITSSQNFGTKIFLAIPLEKYR